MAPSVNSFSAEVIIDNRDDALHEAYARWSALKSRINLITVDNMREYMNDAITIIRLIHEDISYETACTMGGDLIRTMLDDSDEHIE
jgi:hypothetical protein